MAHLFNKDIAYIENSDNPNTLNILPVDNTGKCMTLDGKKEWNFDNSLAPGSKWVEKVNSAGGSGDMLKSVYDTNNNGIVNNSESLQGNDSAYHLNRANHTGVQSISTISNLQFLLDEKQVKTTGMSAQLDNISYNIGVSGYANLQATNLVNTTPVINGITRSGSPFILLNVSNFIPPAKYKISAAISFRSNIAGDFQLRFYRITTGAIVYTQRISTLANNYYSISFTSIVELFTGSQYTFDIGGALSASVLTDIKGSVLIETTNFN